MAEEFVFPEWSKKENWTNDSTKEFVDFCRDILADSSTADEMDHHMLYRFVTQKWFSSFIA